jgi:hypothetical protein
MSLAYFDTSALIKLFINEPGSSTANQAWKSATHLVAARITYAEARAALAAAARIPQRQFSGQDHAQAKDLLEQTWQRMIKINITDSIVHTAGELAEQHALRGYDAVHLACVVHTTADALVCADSALITAAQKRGIGIIDARK